MSKIKETSYSNDQPASYRIHVLGNLPDRWSEWFGGLEIEVVTALDGLKVTTMQGTIIDQAALFGILDRIRDLGLPLLLVQKVDEKLN